MLIAHLHAPADEHLTLLTIVKTLPQRGPLGPELPRTQTSKGVSVLHGHHQLWAVLVWAGPTAVLPIVTSLSFARGLAHSGCSGTLVNKGNELLPTTKVKFTKADVGETLGQSLGTQSVL